MTLPLDMPPKDAVPVNASVVDKLRWLAGYLDGDGCVARNGPTQSIQAVSTDKEFLHSVMLLLQTLGVRSTVRPMRDAGTRTMPDGKGGSKEYECRKTHRLCIGEVGIQTLLSTGFQPHRLNLDRRTPQRSATHYVRVTGVEDRGRSGDTYCFNEPKRGMGVFNGVLTSQCAEILEYSAPATEDRPGEVACCTLASISLPAHVNVDAGKAALLARGPLKLVRCRSRTCIAEAYLKLHGIPFELVPAAYAEERGMSYGTVFDRDDARIGGHRELNVLLRPTFDYAKLAATTRQVVRNLDKVIDVNFYPIPEAEYSNKRHRPLGVGVQGLSDVFNLMRHPYDSEEANLVNARIAATIYYAAMQESADLAVEYGPYDTFAGSPLSRASSSSTSGAWLRSPMFRDSRSIGTGSAPRSSPPVRVTAC